MANLTKPKLTVTGGIIGDNAIRDYLMGTSANNLLAGGGGVAPNTISYLANAEDFNTMEGLDGDDIYIVNNLADVVIEQANEGIDTVYASVNYALSYEVENVVATGAVGVTLTGNTKDNVLDGSQSVFSDTLIGGAGNDTYIIGKNDKVVETASGSTDTIVSAGTVNLSADSAAISGAAYIQNVRLTGSAAVNIMGNVRANSLTGNSAPNLLEGAAGDDTLDGGANSSGGDSLVGGIGNDTYIIRNIADKVTESAGLAGGDDTVKTAFTYDISATGINANAYVENIVLTGNKAVNATGNALANYLQGNGAANMLTGGDGNDVLVGGVGADSLDGGVGDDRLDGGVDSDSLAGGIGNDTLLGSVGADSLEGGDGNDILDGGTGADFMTGGLGNDTYVIDHSGDVIASESIIVSDIDSVQSNMSHTLSIGIENLTLTGTAKIDGTGNDSNNVLIGNDAANMLIGSVGDDTLNGAGGSDTMDGGAGRDVYTVDFAGSPAVTEYSYITFTSLTKGQSVTVAGLTFTASLVVSAAQVASAFSVGTSSNGTFTGALTDFTVTALSTTALVFTSTSAAGTNVTDIAVSSTHATSPVVSTAQGAAAVVGDIVIESTVSNDASEADTVQSSVSFVLPDNVENLTLLAGHLSGTGNSGANVLLAANSYSNVLIGNEGDDTLNADVGDAIYNYNPNTGANVLITGNDTLTGGLGADTITTGAGTDVITLANGAVDSSLTSMDLYSDLVFGKDKIDLATVPTVLNAKVTATLNATDTLASALTTALDASFTGTAVSATIVSVGTSSYLAIDSGTHDGNFIPADDLIINITGYSGVLALSSFF